MPERLNHLAVWVAAIIYFLWGWLWYSVFFAAQWTAYMGRTMGAPSSPVLYIESFVLGLVLAYATGIALTRRPEDQSAGQGISFALFMGISIFGTQTLNQALYEAKPFGFWLIDFGYVIIGFAIMAAIIGAWKKRAAT